MSAMAGAALAVALGVSLYLALRTAPQTPSATPADELDLAAVLAGEEDVEGYARATGPRELAFPADHGPHPAYRNEWWYFTGNLRTDRGRRFGFELTFFRIALAPRPPEHPSAWATRQVYMAHLALTDVAAGRFHAFERFARGAVGLAGARASPFRVWLEDWTVAEREADGSWSLRAGQGEVELELALQPLKPLVLQGEDGLSRKGPEPGNASYYYSLPRIRARGRVRAGGEDFEVDGLAWMDREWSTSALGPGQAGWDWFALHLSNGYDLMLYSLRREDGTTDPHGLGALIGPDGGVRRLERRAARIEVLETWTSPRGGTYPAAWRLTVPGADLHLTLEPWLADQELAVSVRYWEGAVSARGTQAGEPVEGEGYAELTGYARAPPLAR